MMMFSPRSTLVRRIEHGAYRVAFAMAVIALMIGSRIASNSSALAVGAVVNGVMPNAKSAPIALLKPTTRRRAFALRDRRLRFVSR